eukprot:gene7787-15928_t
MFKAITVVASVLAVVNAEAPSKPSVSVAIKESNIDGGLKGLDLNYAGFYKVNDFTLGFKYALDAIRDRPEAVFVKKTFDTFGKGKLTVDTEYNLPENKFSVISNWVMDGAGFVVQALADSKEQLQKLSLQMTDKAILGADSICSKLEYDFQDSSASLKSRYTKGDTGVSLEVDSKDCDSVVTVAHTIEQDTFSPSVSLKTGAFSYGWLRKWSGGSLESKLKVKDSLEVTWSDEASSGVWKTKAIIPLDDSTKKTKISVSRDWAL